MNHFHWSDFSALLIPIGLYVVFEIFIYMYAKVHNLLDMMSGDCDHF